MYIKVVSHVLHYIIYIHPSLSSRKSVVSVKCPCVRFLHQGVRYKNITYIYHKLNQSGTQFLIFKHRNNTKILSYLVHLFHNFPNSKHITQLWFRSYKINPILETKWKFLFVPLQSAPQKDNTNVPNPCFKYGTWAGLVCGCPTYNINCCIFYYYYRENFPINLVK